MELSELRKCDGCDGPIVQQGSVTFYQVEVDTAVINPRAVNQVVVTAQDLGGSVTLAEIFSTGDAIRFLSEEGAPKVKILLCQSCFLRSPHRSIAMLVEQRTAVEEREKTDD